MGIIAKRGIAVTTINIIGVAIAALSILFIQTKYLSKDQIGAIKVINSFGIVIFPFLALGFGSAVMRFYHKTKVDQKLFNQFVTFTLLLPLILIAFFTIVGFIFEDFIYVKFFNSSPYLKNISFLLAGMVFHFTYNTIIEGYMAAKAKIVIPNILKNVVSKLYLIALVLLFSLDLLEFSSLMLLYVVLHMLNSTILLFLFFRSEKPKLPVFGLQKRPLFKELRSYSSYMILGSLGSVIVTQIDIIMTGAITKDLGEVGVYTVAFFMGVVIEVPKRPLTQLVIPILSRDLEEDQDNVAKIYKQSAINLSLAGIFFFLIIWVNIDDIFTIIPNGEIYEKGKYVVFFIGLSKIFDLSLGVNYEIIQYSKHYRWNLFLMPFLAIISITSNYIFIPMYGIIGTAIATAASILIYNIIRSYLVYKAFKMHSFSWGHVKIIGIAIVIFFGADYLSFFANPYLDIICKSAIVVLVYGGASYFLKVSEEANRVIHTILKRLSIIEK